jgi:hypothetical protein
MTDTPPTRAPHPGDGRLVAEPAGEPSPAARGTGHDAEWLGHAWVDGRKSPADVDALAAALRGFDGVHLDLEPVDRGDQDMVSLLADAHTLTQQRHAILSLSASLLAPAPVAGLVAAGPGRPALWSPGYLSELADHVDQVALMAYDTWAWTPSLYAGYVRRLTTYARDAAPAGVALFIGVPAYHNDNLRHHQDVETIAPAIRGERLALGDRPSTRPFGLAIYVDFTATAHDWATYQHDWQLG